MTFDLIDKHCSELSRKNHRISGKLELGNYKLVFLFLSLFTLRCLFFENVKRKYTFV